MNFSSLCSSFAPPCFTKFCEATSASHCASVESSSHLNLWARLYKKETICLIINLTWFTCHHYYYYIYPTKSQRGTSLAAVKLFNRKVNEFMEWLKPRKRSGTGPKGCKTVNSIYCQYAVLTGLLKHSKVNPVIILNCFTVLFQCHREFIFCLLFCLHIAYTTSSN